MTDKLVSYVINPIPHPGVVKIQESALADIAGVLKVMLGDHLHGVIINEDGIEILVEPGLMDRILEKSTILKSCNVVIKKLSMQ
jgi:hypothetical protein